MVQHTVQSLGSTRVVVHPLVLLSVVDHYNRVAKNTKKRVVGVLLGQVYGSVVNVSNSFAVPFEEEFDKTTNTNVWFLDHNYVETMRDMFKKVSVKENLIGWYHSGPKLQSSDLQINELFKKYASNPVLVVVNVQQKKIGLPTDAYFAVEEIHNDGTATTRNFEHVASEIGAEESEEIGVEHLLREVKDNAIGTLSKSLSDQIESLKGLSERLEKTLLYLEEVVEGKLPINYEIIQNIQKIFNLLSKTTSGGNQSKGPGELGIVDSGSAEISRATNDSYLILYISSMNREAELAIEKQNSENETQALAKQTSARTTSTAEE
ncbi:hypothetical protein BB559_004913 [Furculomyces boomerangus]|uniref:MPN domain-containing protein n=2 Tax=Harpellales TaxID=61421 RepID=A0A2T9YBZ1_9FUNG|nr:hypothetical protein BB559_004913 [Furculomyces boomerangus]PWA01966.1 hypothetical protein BB558_001903 [Smittium angustum]